jgi:excinuclease ABC subunit C
MPKYNILLKDDKGYPYIRLDMKAKYPTPSMVSKISNDGAVYYGPYGSRGVTQSILEAIRITLKLPSCKKQFPKDIGKGRPCLHYHMNQCAGWCQPGITYSEYLSRISQVKQLLDGNYKSVANDIKMQMLDAAERMEFELAAGLRDRLNAVEALGQKQLVTAGTLADTDVIGYGQTEAKACFTVLHYCGGNLLDKDFETFSLPDDPEAAVSSLLKQYYLSRGSAPKIVLLPFAVEDSELFEQLLEQQCGRKTRLRVPQRGDNAALVALANKNALEEAERISSRDEKISGTLQLLGKMLSSDPPRRIESFDISNISGTDIVASMVVFEDGKPKRSAYKRFKIDNLKEQDDYESMRQTVSRRFAHFVQEDNGFESKPDLVLIDGGVSHAKIAESVLDGMELTIPVFGMVKDDRHRTRALVTPNGMEINIDSQPAVFSFVGNIQEETHRFAITYHRQLRSKRLKYSELDKIAGIGPKRKQDLLKQFKSISSISQASLSELERILPQNAALSVYQHFHTDREK